MASLKVFQTQDQPMMLMQKAWSSALNPILANYITQGIVLSGIELLANDPLTFNHYLSRQMNGWFIIDNTAFCEIKRTEPLNNTTLTLEANANTTISLWVF